MQYYPTFSTKAVLCTMFLSCLLKASYTMSISDDATSSVSKSSSENNNPQVIIYGFHKISPFTATLM